MLEEKDCNCEDLEKIDCEEDGIPCGCHYCFNCSACEDCKNS